MKRIIALILLVAGLAGVAIAAAPVIAASDFAKRRIAAQIKAWSGHPVTFAGEPQVDLFPHLSLTISDARIGTDGETPLVTMERLTCRLRLLPFLIGRVEVAEFELVRPHFHIALDSGGHSNWYRPHAAGASDTARPAPLRAETRLGRFRVVDGQATFTDPRNGRHEQIFRMSMNLSWRHAGEPLSGTGLFYWRGERVEFNVLLREPLDLLDAGISPARFALASPPVRIAFTGAVDASGDTRLEGTATVMTPSVRRILAWLNVPIGRGAILGAGLVEGQVSWQRQTARFAGAQVELDGNSATGDLAFDLSGLQPGISASLDFPSLDLTAYVETLQATFARLDGPATRSPLPHLLDIVDAEIEAVAGEVHIGSGRLGRGGGTLSLGAGEAVLSVDELQLYGGRLSGLARVAENDGAFSAAASLDIGAARAEALLGALAGIDRLHGTLSGTVDVSASGGTIDALAGSVSGAARLSITAGSFEGATIDDLAMSTGRPPAPAANEDDGQLRFDTLTAELSLSGPELTGEEIRISSRDFEAVIEGTIGLGTGAVHAGGLLTLAADGIATDSIASGAAMPFIMRGSAGAPIVRPDYRRLMPPTADGIAPPADPAPDAPPNG